MRLFVGNGIGPLILASVAVAASMILSHAACMCDVSKDFKRILIFDAATGAAAVFRRERETTRVREAHTPKCDFERERFFIHSKKGMNGKRKRRRRRNEDGSRALSLSSGGDAHAIGAQSRATSEQNAERERELLANIHFIHFFQVFTRPQKRAKKERGHF